MIIAFAFGVAVGMGVSAAGVYFFPGITGKVYGWIASLIAASAGALHLGGGMP